jgi:hypothetical protein
MKYLKMLGLAAVAAMALMAVVGAGTASATAVYGNGAKLGVGAEIKASLTGGTARLENTAGEVLDTCTGGEVKGTISNAGGEAATVSGSVSTANLTWSGCTKNPTQTTSGGTLEIHHISGKTNGTLTASGFNVTVAGIFGVSCIYGTGSNLDLGEVEGSKSKQAILNINVVVNGAAGNSFLCPSHAIWNADYKVTNYENFYVEAS